MLEKMKSAYVITCLVLGSLAVSVSAQPLKRSLDGVETPAKRAQVAGAQTEWKDLPPDMQELIVGQFLDGRGRASLAQTNRDNRKIVAHVRDQAQRGIITLHASTLAVFSRNTTCLGYGNFRLGWPPFPNEYSSVGPGNVIGNGPVAAVLGRDGQYLFVMNESTNNVSVFDTGTHQVVGMIPGAPCPMPRLHSSGPVAGILSQDGQSLFVINHVPYSDCVRDSLVSSVSVIDTNTHQVVGEPIPVGLASVAGVLSRNGSLYVINRASHNVSVINTVNRQVVQTIRVGDYPFAGILSGDGEDLYVMNEGSNDVRIINTGTRQVVGRIAACFTTNSTFRYRSQWNSPHPPVQKGTLLFVMNKMAHNIIVVNTLTRQVVQTIQVGCTPYAGVLSKNGQDLFVMHEDSNNVSVINTSTYQVVERIPVGPRPHAGVLSQDGRHLFMTSAADVVSIIDTSTYQVLERIYIGQKPIEAVLSGGGQQLFVINKGSAVVAAIRFKFLL